MKKIEMWEAEDGKLFYTEVDCLAHENKRFLLQKLDEDLYLRDVDPEDILSWIYNNLDFLGLKEK